MGAEPLCASAARTTIGRGSLCGADRDTAATDGCAPTTDVTPKNPPLPSSADTPMPAATRMFNDAAASMSTNAEIIQAIQDGEANRFDNLATSCHADPGFGSIVGGAIAGGISPNSGFTAIIGTNEWLIAGAAYNAKRLYQRLTPENVGENFRVKSIAVVVLPDDPGRSSRTTYYVPAMIQHVVLKSRNGNSVAQPVQVLTEVMTWSNLVGGTIQGNKATALFQPFALNELPRGDIDIVIVTSAGERKCKISNKDLEKVFFSRRR
jgi:hypothetical protein